jgi:hypothetical protein
MVVGIFFSSLPAFLLLGRGSTLRDQFPTIVGLTTEWCFMKTFTRKDGCECDVQKKIEEKKYRRTCVQVLAIVTTNTG